MAPTKVGFIGLSQTGWGKNAHLPYLKQSKKYETVAICNSSISSVKEAIRVHGLSESIRAYGDPEGGHFRCNRDIA
jgi:predicted dehydrogenase